MDRSTGTKPHTIFLIRHGETKGNLVKMFLPPAEDGLTDLGISQTETLGNALKDVAFTKAYCSPYLRTVQTTEIILKQNEFSKNLPFKSDDRIREVWAGELEGAPLSYQIITKAIGVHLQKGLPKSTFTSHGSEVLSDVHARAQTFMEDVVKDLTMSGKSETVLIVAHAGLLSCFMEMLNEWDKVHVVDWDDSCGKIMKNTTFMMLSLSQQLDKNSKRELVILKKHEKSHLKDAKKSTGPDSLTKMAETEEGKVISGCYQV